MTITYSGIFTKQAESILNLYKLLVKFDADLRFSIRMMESKFGQEYLVSAMDSWSEFHGYFEDNRILLPEDVVSTIARIQTDVFQSTIEYRNLSLKSLSDLEHHEINELLKNKEKAGKIASEFPALKIKLESRFRELIGSTITPN